MCSTSTFVRIALLAFVVGGLSCTATATTDAGTDAVVGPDIATACAGYCQLFSSQYSTSASQCQAACMCRASGHPSCTAVIANCFDCAGRSALLSCMSGDSLSTLCDDQRTARDNCLAGATAADAGPACMTDASTDAGSSDVFVAMGSCQSFCDRQAAAGCAGFDPTGCMSTCQTIVITRPSHASGPSRRECRAFRG